MSKARCPLGCTGKGNSEPRAPTVACLGLLPSHIPFQMLGRCRQHANASCRRPGPEAVEAYGRVWLAEIQGLCQQMGFPGHQCKAGCSLPHYPPRLAHPAHAAVCYFSFVSRWPSPLPSDHFPTARSLKPLPALPYRMPLAPRIQAHSCRDLAVFTFIISQGPCWSQGFQWSGEFKLNGKKSLASRHWVKQLKFPHD